MSTEITILILNQKLSIIHICKFMNISYSEGENLVNI